MQHDIHLPKFGGVLLHTLPMPFPEVMSMDPLVLYIPSSVELGINESFKSSHLITGGSPSSLSVFL
jgi:hypothetical protein